MPCAETIKKSRMKQNCETLENIIYRNYWKKHQEIVKNRERSWNVKSWNAVSAGTRPLAKSESWTIVKWPGRPAGALPSHSRSPVQRLRQRARALRAIPASSLSLTSAVAAIPDSCRLKTPFDFSWPSENSRECSRFLQTFLKSSWYFLGLLWGVHGFPANVPRLSSDSPQIVLELSQTSLEFMRTDKIVWTCSVCASSFHRSSAFLWAGFAVRSLCPWRPTSPLHSSNP